MAAIILRANIAAVLVAIAPTVRARGALTWRGRSGAAAAAAAGGLAPPRRHLVSIAAAAAPRGPFARVTPQDVTAFKDMLGDTAVVTDPETLKTASTDWMRKWSGDASLLLRPASTQQVAQILKYCNDRRIAVVPQGGNTGLVGGSVPVHDEVIVSTARMQQIEHFDEDSGILVCQAGCVLEKLDQWLRERQYMMPLDLGAKGSCHIGGNVSTNAGGLRYLRYGSLHGSVLGLEAVKADGTVLNMLSTLRKDNVGPDLKQVFIGSEGTLGFVTKVALQVVRAPASVNVAFFACSSFEQVRKVLAGAKALLGEVLSAAEFVDRRSLEFVLQYRPGTEDPFSEQHQFYVLIETSGSNADHDQAKLDQLLTHLMDSQAVQDGVVAPGGVQARKLWQLREDVSVCLTTAGMVYKYDISLPLKEMYEIVYVMRKRLQDLSYAAIVGYGHLGDCNLHLNIGVPRDKPNLVSRIEPFVFEYVASKQGSISAEHGVGVCKRDFMHIQKSPQVIAQLKELKALFDPNGILNPYKVLPAKA